MVYAYDKIAQMPTRDLYDTQLMAMAINAAKDQYDKAEKRLNDLESMYDFYSPIQKDVESYKRIFIDKVKNTLNDLYNKGIDPLRSAEGRMAIEQLKRTAPIDQMNMLKQSAANAQQYLKNLAALQQAGKYNPDYEDFILGGNTLDGYDTLANNAIWNIKK